MLLHVSDPSAQQDRGLRANIAVADSYLSLQRLDESIEAAEKCCLARSAFTDERNRATGWNVETDVIKGYD